MAFCLPHWCAVPLLLALPLLVVSSSSRAWADGGENRFLDMDLMQLMEITITSVAKKPQSLSDTPAAVFVITQEDIHRSGVTSIAQALVMAPGVNVAQISASKWSVASRGFSGYTSNKLLVLIDGRSVYSPAYSGVFWDMQNTLLEDIDRIEVIRGPGGTIWGANAVNGVINIITKKAKDTQGGLVRLGGGTQDMLQTGARYGGKIGDNTFARMYAMGNNWGSNDLYAPGASIDAHDGGQSGQTGFRADGTVGTSNEWTLQGDVYRNTGDQTTFPFWLPNSTRPLALRDDYTAKGGNLLGNWQHKLNATDKVSLKAYFDSVHRIESYYDLAFDTLDLDLQYETLLGARNSLTMGIGFRQVNGDFQTTYLVSLPDQTDYLYSAFLQDQINLVTDRLWLTLGSKFEHNDFTGGEWQPSARLLWKPQTDHSLWLSVARAVRTPAMVENNGAVTFATVSPAPGMFIPLKFYGSQAFASETLIAYEAGYRWQARRNLSFDLSTYYNQYDEIYDAIPSETQPGQQITNASTGHGYGLEFSANWQPTAQWALALAYTWMHLELEPKDQYQAFFAGYQTPWADGNVPSTQISLRSAVDLTDNWQFNTWLRYTDAIWCRNTVDLLNSYRVKAHANLDANLIWKATRDLEVMLAVQNLFNNRELEYVSEFITPPTEIDRSVYLKLTWKF